MVKQTTRSYLIKVFGAIDISKRVEQCRVTVSFVGRSYTSITLKGDGKGRFIWNYPVVITLDAPVETMMGSFVKNVVKFKVEDQSHRLNDIQKHRRSKNLSGSGLGATYNRRTPPSIPVPTVGTCSLNIAKVAGERKDTMELIPLRGSSGSQTGYLGIGWYRTIIRTPTEIRAQRKKKWFEKKADKESRKMEKQMDRMIDFMFGGDTLRKLKSVVQGATGAEAEAMVMYELMRLVKTQDGRNLFAYKLDPDHLPAKNVKKIASTVEVQSPREFEFLSVLVKAALREGANNRDFVLNKVLMDVSYLYYYVDKETGSKMFLYSEIAHGATFSSMEYWESVFVATEQIVNPPTEKKGDVKTTKAQRENTFKERTTQLIKVFLHQMVFFSDVNATIALNFAERMCLMFDLTDKPMAKIKAGITGRLKIRSRFELGRSTRMSAIERKVIANRVSKKQAKNKPKHSVTDVHVNLDGVLKPSKWVRYRTNMGLYFHNVESNLISDLPPPNSIFEDSSTSIRKEPRSETTGKYLFREVKLSILNECWMQTKVGQTRTWEGEGGRYRSVKGTMIITNFRVEFKADSGLAWMKVMIPVHSMERFDHDVFTVTTTQGMAQEMQVMVFHTKDYRTLRVTALYSEELTKLLRKIKKLAFPKKVSDLFAFIYRQPVAAAEDGWEIYDLERELNRQGAMRAGWRITDINQDFRFSPTYPQYFAVPEFVKDEELGVIAKFRSKRRMAALTYYWGRTQAVMVRCAQPMVGLTGNRCKEEEMMVQELRITAIFDARPTENAFANKAKGGGYEDARYYSRKGDNKCEIHFCDVHNIHKMRTSLQQVVLACEQQLTRRTDDFQELILRSRWTAHVRNLVLQSDRLARTMLRGESVLVHCSDGWDRTSQMCSLAQIIIDPYFRTIEGLAVLIEKDWCSFGHMFHKRVGHGSSKFADSDRSPIFVQFLDALWQTWHQAPERFEYNEWLLEFLAQEVVSCKYGSFLFDCEKQRNEHLVKQSTVSVWTYVCRTGRKDFMNPVYLPALNTPHARKKPNGGRMRKVECEFLSINMDCRNFRVWPYYYRQDHNLMQSLRGAGKYNTGPQRPTWVGERVLRLHESKANLQMEWLRSKLEEYKKKYKRAAEQLQIEKSAHVNAKKILERERKKKPDLSRHRENKEANLKSEASALPVTSVASLGAKGDILKLKSKRVAPHDRVRSRELSVAPIPNSMVSPSPAAVPPPAPTPIAEEAARPTTSTSNKRVVPASPVRASLAAGLSPNRISLSRLGSAAGVAVPAPPPARSEINNTGGGGSVVSVTNVVGTSKSRNSTPLHSPTPHAGVPGAVPLASLPPPRKDVGSPAGGLRGTVGSRSGVITMPPPPPIAEASPARGVGPNTLVPTRPISFSRAHFGSGRTPTPSLDKTIPMRKSRSVGSSNPVVNVKSAGGPEPPNLPRGASWTSTAATAASQWLPLRSNSSHAAHWGEQNSDISAIGIAPTVQTAKTIASEIEEESPRSISPNPSALHSFLSLSPTTQMSSVMAVGERDNHGWEQVAQALNEKKEHKAKPPPIPSRARKGISLTPKATGVLAAQVRVSQSIQNQRLSPHRESLDEKRDSMVREKSDSIASQSSAPILPSTCVELSTTSVDSLAENSRRFMHTDDTKHDGDAVEAALEEKLGAVDEGGERDDYDNKSGDITDAEENSVDSVGDRSGMVHEKMGAGEGEDTKHEQLDDEDPFKDEKAAKGEDPVKEVEEREESGAHVCDGSAPQLLSQLSSEEDIQSPEKQKNNLGPTVPVVEEEPRDMEQIIPETMIPSESTNDKDRSEEIKEGVSMHVKSNATLSTDQGCDHDDDKKEDIPRTPPPPPEDTDDENSSEDEDKGRDEKKGYASPSSKPPRTRSASYAYRNKEEASAFDWSGTINPSKLFGTSHSRKNFFVTVRRSTLQSGRSGHGVNHEDGGVGRSLRSVNVQPPPPPDSDEDDEFLSD